jgi:hypothetical protein
MRKIEQRNIEISYCDFCGDEAPHLDQCAVCKREMCGKDSGREHAAYSVEVYRYRDHARSGTRKVCKYCSRSVIRALQVLFDVMIPGAAVCPSIEQVEQQRRL